MIDMRRQERAAEAIAAAETAVALLVSEAGQEREWDEASAFIDIGRQLRSLADELSNTRLPQGADVKIPAPIPARTASTTPAANVTKRRAYPHFFKEGEVLVKVAWSKSKRGEYEHKSPQKVLTALVIALLEVGSKGQRFVMDKVLPLRDTGNGGAEVPEYQAYVCLAWLRHEGFVQQHGRSGYSIPKPDELAESVANCWGRLNSR